jgi:fatty acid desaturase
MAVRKKPNFLFAYSYWDVIPVLAMFAHTAFVIAMFVAFTHHAPWWLLAIMGVMYAYSISWNINGVSHNFIHNPYFKSRFLNLCFSWLESVTVGFSQTFYDCVHRRHHMGNSDRPDETGETIDWISIYRHGHHGQAENVWTFTFLSYFREDIGTTYRELKKRSARDAAFGCFEIASTFAVFITFGLLSWKLGHPFFLVYFIPFYYLGHSLSSLNGWYRHYGGNPDDPIAWGVSSYNWLYNLVWFNNGYHAEHHYRPKIHWTKMKKLHSDIQDEQKAHGVRSISVPHPFGFLDASLPPLEETRKGAPAYRTLESTSPSTPAVEA